MKRKKCNSGTKVIEREVNYIPVRYIIAVLITRFVRAIVRIFAPML